MSYEQPTHDMLYAIADAVGDTMSRGYQIDKVTPLELGPIIFKPEMRFSHSVVDKDYIAVCYKIGGDLYATFAYEPKNEITTVIILDKLKLMKHFDQPNGQLTNEVNKLANRGKLPTLDAYIQELNPGVRGAAFRKKQGNWTKLEVG